ncbi:hypothetical protein F4604DRAFT_1947301 [Suillus subluteus]|nr:hypothetical protein F4604DRAFT_1947301 [Suillus subluteus]
MPRKRPSKTANFAAGATHQKRQKFDHEERAISLQVRAECPKFQCEKGVDRCCCRRMLYNEPDFVNVKSLLEIACEARGFRAIFFPKFHCELNFIEQCWGYSKRLYREFPVSSKEADLERNVLAALESVPLDAICRFSTRSLRFMDAYRRGLDGKQATSAGQQQMNISDVLEASAIQGVENFSSDAAKLYRFSTTSTMPAYPEIFQVVRALQHASTELTIFSRELGETVTIAYPVNRATGERIISHNLKDWTRRRNIAWECFCGLLTEHCTPVRFDTNRHGHAMAYCHQSPSECGFSLNISEARETALYESVYTDVLTRVYLNHPRLVNLRDLVLRVHRDRLTAMPSEHAQLFPYFEGYCGTPISALAPSQRGGAVCNIASYRRRPISALNMRHNA